MLASGASVPAPRQTMTISKDNTMYQDAIFLWFDGSVLQRAQVILVQPKAMSLQLLIM
jgi:hypothetical protein